MATESQGPETGENNIQVFIRIRPPGEDEVAHTQIVEVDEGNTQVILKQNPTPKIFSFDYVADHTASQELIFNRLGKQVIENCIAGYNGTIFAYGQTGSGKTFTMLGPSEECENFQSEFRGVIPRTFEYLYSLVNREKEMHGEDKQFLCKCSFLEIYNEQIFDLLEPTNQALQLRESFKTGVYVAGLAEKVVSDAYEAYEVLSNSWMNRRVGETSMNRESSRSHAVFTLHIESKQKKGAIESIRSSMLHLVDLAGSERQKDTGASGQRLREAGAINKSLSNLGNVIMSLVSESKDGKKRYIPYRDSKLTFLLRDSLGGNSRTSLIACIHAGSKCIGETLSTLQFAKRAKMIKNKAIKNENAHGNVKELQAEIRSLKEQLQKLQVDGVMPIEVATVPGDETGDYRELRTMFHRAMMLQQTTAMKNNELKDMISQMKDICGKKDKALMSNKMIIKFRDRTIKQLEAKVKGSDEPDTQLADLQQEVEQLRRQLDQNDEAARLKGELRRVQSELRATRSEPGTIARAEQDTRAIEQMDIKYKQLLAEQKAQGDDAYITPQRLDTVSTATVERLKSQLMDMEGEVTELVQKLLDTKQEAEKEEGVLRGDLESKVKHIQDLEECLKSHTEKNKMEKEAMQKQHLETVMTITTPKKEKYRLRNRTVLGSTHTPDLDGSIQFEYGTLDEGILDEEMPEELEQQQQEALLEELTREREKTALLEDKLTNYEMEMLNKESLKTKLENQVKDLEQRLAHAEEAAKSTKDRTDALERELKNAILDRDTASSGVRDYEIVCTQVEKDLKETKLIKNKAIDEMQFKMAEFEANLDQVKKERDQLDAQNQQSTMELKDEREKCKIINDTLIEYTCYKEKSEEYKNKWELAGKELLEEKERHGKLISSFSKEKDAKANALRILENELEVMRVQAEEADLRCTKQQKKSDDQLALVTKNLKHAEEKVSNQYSELQNQKDEMEELTQKCASTQEELEYYQEEKAKLETTQKELEEKSTNLEKTQQELEEKNTNLEKTQQELEEKNTDLEKIQQELKEKNTRLEETQQGLEEQIAKLHSALHELEVKLEKTQKELEEKKTKLEETRQELKEKNAKLDQTQQELENLMQFQQGLEEQIAKLQSTLHELEGKLEKTQQTLEEKNTKLSKNQQELEEKNARFEKAQQELEEKKTKLEETQQELEEKNARFEKAQQELEEMNTKLSKTQQELEEKNARFEKTHQEQAEKNAIMENTQHALEVKLEKTQQELEEKNTRFEKTQQELEEKNTMLKKTQQELEEKSTRSEKTQQELEERNARFEKTRQELEEKNTELEKTQQELEEKNDRLDKTQKVLEEKSTNLETIQQELEEKNILLQRALQKKKETVEKLTNAIMATEQLQAQIEMNQQDVEDLQENIKAKEEDIKKLKDSLQNQEQKSVELTISKQQEITNLLSQLGEQVTIQSQLTSQRDEAEKARRQSDIAKAALTAQLEQAKSDQAKSDIAKAALTAQLEQAKSDQAKSDEETKRIKMKLQEAESKSNQLCCDVKLARDTLRLYQEEAQKSLEESTEKAANQAKKLENQLSASEDKCSRSAAQLNLYMLELKKSKDNFEEEKKRLEADKSNISEELQHLKSAVRDIQTLYADSCKPDMCDLDFMLKSMKTIKEEHQKLSEENAKLLGHQNPKQKIRHIEQLKHDKDALKLSNDTLELKNKQLTDQIRELKNRLKLGQPTPVEVLKENAEPRHKTFFSGDFSGSVK